MCSECGREAIKLTRAMCSACYQRWKKSNRDKLRPVMRGRSPLDRVMARVEKTDSCWLYCGRLTAKGYGSISIWDGRRHLGARVHRVTYEAANGPIPDGLEIDHLCRVRHCVRPDHLEAVTHEENVRRRSEAQTHCKHGHEFTPENTYRKAAGTRSCRTCAIMPGRVTCPVCGEEKSRANLSRHIKNIHGASVRELGISLRGAA